MANNKAFVRYANNKAVPGSLIVRKKAPSVGTWKEVNYDLCCDDVCPQPTPFCTENWAFENFEGTTFRNGDPIPQVTDPDQWATLTTPAWRYYNNDPANGRIHGKLYNWYAINDSRGLAPVGWRVPSLQDWQQLAECLGGAETAGQKLKTTGNLNTNDGLWTSLNTGTNEVGFSALPSGTIDMNGSSTGLGTTAAFWTSSEQAGFGIAATLFNSLSLLVMGGALNPKFGRSVRLIKEI